MKGLTWLLLLVLLSSGTVFAQQPMKPKVGVSDDLGKALEVALSELEHLRNESKIKDEVIKAKDIQIGALNGLVVIERARAEKWAEAALERKTAITFDDKAAKLQDAEILRLREERDEARKAQKVYGAFGVGIGILLGVLSQRKQ